jgi:NAD+ synthase
LPPAFIEKESFIMLGPQANIIRGLGVASTFDVGAEIERRVTFLVDYLRESAMNAYVLGISGGIDSLTAAMLAQSAVSRLRSHGRQVQFIACRLPYGMQVDDADAKVALDVISPDRTVTIDIKPAADALLLAVRREADDLFQPGARFPPR